MDVKAAIRRSAAWRALQANRLAAGAKRLDLCAAQLAHLLHLAGRPSLEGRTCLEVGSGWVLTHSLVLHLLGARRVVATDILPEAQPAVTRSAVLRSIPSIVRDILSPFADHEALRERMDRLCSWQDWSFGGLARLGIEYQAPLDLALVRPSHAVDFVYSNSVLEHVPSEQAATVVRNLAASLNPGGAMIHAIHLEDHRDHARRPFDFLSISPDRYPPSEQSARGNRLRASEWMRIFNGLPGCRTETLYAWRRSADLLPAGTSGDLDDVRTGHLALHTTRAA